MDIWAAETVSLKYGEARYEFHGFFSSLERAQEFIDRFAFERVRGKWIEQSPDCWMHDTDPEGKQCPHRIEKYTIDEPIEKTPGS